MTLSNNVLRLTRIIDYHEVVSISNTQVIINPRKNLDVYSLKILHYTFK